MIVVKLMGGLGNQLFQYAAGRALALKHQTELKLDLSLLNADPKNVYTKRELELHVFNITASIASDSELEVFYRRTFFQKVVTKLFPSLPSKYFIGNQKGFEYDEACKKTKRINFDTSENLAPLCHRHEQYKHTHV